MKADRDVIDELRVALLEVGLARARALIAELEARHGLAAVRATRRRVGLADLRAFARQRGGRCLAKRYARAKTKVRWRCREGHEWEATWDKIKQGSWCPTCGHRKATLSDMQARAAARGGKCLSTHYESNRKKLTFQCSRGHVWQALPYKVLVHWCQKCAGIARRGTTEEMARLAAERGGRCLSVRYVNSVGKLEFECAERHRFWMSPRDVKRDKWCARCAGVARVTLSDMVALARERAGTCLSNRFVNRKTKLRWRCRRGHEWEATPNAVKQGGWCHECARIQRWATRRANATRSK